MLLLEKTCGLTGAGFRLNNGVPWSIEVETALKRSTSLSFVGELPENHGYRLGENGAPRRRQDPQEVEGSTRNCRVLHTVEHARPGGVHTCELPRIRNQGLNRERRPRE